MRAVSISTSFCFVLSPLPALFSLCFLHVWLSTLLSTGSSTMILVAEWSFSNRSLELAFLVSLGISCSCPSHCRHPSFPLACYMVQFTVMSSPLIKKQKKYTLVVMHCSSFILGSHLFEMFLYLFPGVRQCCGCLSPSYRLLCIICSLKRMIDFLLSFKSEHVALVFSPPC